MPESPTSISLLNESASIPAHATNMQIVKESATRPRFTVSGTMHARYYDCFDFYKTISRPFTPDE